MASETIPESKAHQGPIHSANIRPICRLDLDGMGQVIVQNNYAYVGYMYGPKGTSIFDVSDPKNPKHLSTIMHDCPQSHSHKVRVIGDIMIVNSEERPATDKPYHDGGFRIYDVSDRTNPRLITFHKTFGKGVHRFDCDERYAYISTEMEGFVGNILVIYDIQNPAKPLEVSRWWMPGQNVAAGEDPHPLGTAHRLHHAMREGDQLYAGCWMSGYAIIDISDITAPKTLGTFDVHPPATEPSHTFLKVPFPIGGRDIALGIDEERSNRRGDVGKPHAPLYIFDVTDPTAIKKLTEYHLPESASPFKGPRFGTHQFREKMDDTLTYVTWFAAGLRILDIANPEDPAEVGYFIPQPAKSQSGPLTSDVTMDENGLLYIVDKNCGLDIIEFNR